MPYVEFNVGGNGRNFFELDLPCSADLFVLRLDVVEGIL